MLCVFKFHLKPIFVGFDKNIILRIINLVVACPSNFPIINGYSAQTMCFTNRCYGEKCTKCTGQLRIVQSDYQLCSRLHCLKYELKCQQCFKLVPWNANPFKVCTTYRCFTKHGYCQKCANLIRPHDDLKGCFPQLCLLENQIHTKLSPTIHECYDLLRTLKLLGYPFDFQQINHIDLLYVLEWIQNNQTKILQNHSPEKLLLVMQFIIWHFKEEISKMK